eukprot:2377770-Rhodomonas_salina.3
MAANSEQPPSIATTVVPRSVSPGAVIEQLRRAMSCPVDSGTTLPPRSTMQTTGAGARSAPPYCKASGAVSTETWWAGPTDTRKRAERVEESVVSSVAVKSSAKAWLWTSTERSVNTATPFSTSISTLPRSPALGTTDPFAKTHALTVAFAFSTVLPPVSTTATTGCLASGSPPVPFPGCVSMVRYAPTPYTTVNAREDTPINPALSKRRKVSERGNARWITRSAYAATPSAVRKRVVPVRYDTSSPRYGARTADSPGIRDAFTNTSVSTVLFPRSRTSTSGCVRSTKPATVFDGCSAMNSAYAAPVWTPKSREVHVFNACLRTLPPHPGTSVRGSRTIALRVYSADRSVLDGSTAIRSAAAGIPSRSDPTLCSGYKLSYHPYDRDTKPPLGSPVRVTESPIHGRITAAYCVEAGGDCHVSAWEQQRGFESAPHVTIRCDLCLVERGKMHETAKSNARLGAHFGVRIGAMGGVLTAVDEVSASIEQHLVAEIERGTKSKKQRSPYTLCQECV